MAPKHRDNTIPCPHCPGRLFRDAYNLGVHQSSSLCIGNTTPPERKVYTKRKRGLDLISGAVPGPVPIPDPIPDLVPVSIDVSVVSASASASTSAPVPANSVPDAPVTGEESKPSSYPCLHSPVCKKVFTSRRSLNQHMTRICSSSSSLPCRRCIRIQCMRNEEMDKEEAADRGRGGKRKRACLARYSFGPVGQYIRLN